MNPWHLVLAVLLLTVLSACGPGPSPEDVSRIVAWDEFPPPAGSDERHPIRSRICCVGPSGSSMWECVLQGGGDVLVEGVSAAEGGTCYVTGWFERTLRPPRGDAATENLVARAQGDAFLVALGPGGRSRWARATTGHPEGGGWSQGICVATFASGSCVVAGNHQGAATFPRGSPEAATLHSMGSPSVFLARYEPDGTLAWARQTRGRLDPDRGAALTTGKDGSCVVVGDSRGDMCRGTEGEYGARLRPAPRRTIFVARYCEDGELLWLREARGSGSAGGKALVLGSNGACYVTGWLIGSVRWEAEAVHETASAKGTMDAFIARYGSGGELDWVRVLGGSEEDWAEGRFVAMGPDGACVVRGRFGGRLRLPAADGAAEITAAGEEDSFHVVFDVNGQVVLARRDEHQDSDGGEYRTRTEDSERDRLGR